MAGAVAAYVLDRNRDIVDDPDRYDGIQILGRPVLFGRRDNVLAMSANLIIAPNLAAGFLKCSQQYG